MILPSEITKTGSFRIKASHIRCTSCGLPFRRGFEPRDGDSLCLDCRADLAATMLPLVFDDEAPP